MAQYLKSAAVMNSLYSSNNVSRAATKIALLSSTDALDIVFCKDCTHRRKGMFCDNHWCYRTSAPFMVQDNDYCRWGEVDTDTEIAI